MKALKVCRRNMNELEGAREGAMSVALTVLELLIFNLQKLRGSRDPGWPRPLSRNIKVLCPDCPWKHACQI